jgi:cytochrome c oxidase accessory protein FixG
MMPASWEEMPACHERIMKTTYRSRRIASLFISTLFFFLLPFFNIIRLDVPTLRFYFFHSVLWVEEFYFLFLFLLIFSWLILTFSMMYGRVWCGWLCPQTTLNELAAWLKKKMEALFQVKKVQGFTANKAAAGAMLVLLETAISLLVGFNLVSYFVDPYRMLVQVRTFSLNPIVAGFIIGIAAFVLADMIFIREKFCTKACPYGMLQMVITDDKTQVVRYLAERQHECIECRACVKACMMGIDIRTSPYQTECTQCGDCVDACTKVMGRLKPPRPTLIRFSWGESAVSAGQSWFKKIGLLDVKRWVLSSLVFVFVLALAYMSQARSVLNISIMGDRSTLYRQGEQGEIINDFILKITNRDIRDDLISVGQDERLQVRLKDADYPIAIKAGETRKIKMAITARGTGLQAGPNRVKVNFISALDSLRTVAAELVFFMPERTSP